MTCFRDRQGALWFGASGGLSRFMPIPDEPSHASPPILISDLHIAGSRRFISALDETDILLPDLPADQNQLQIDFTGLSFSPGDALRYQYKLESAGEDWSAPTEQRSITYRLAPGRYRFFVRAVDSDGVVSSIRPLSYSEYFRLCGSAGGSSRSLRSDSRSLCLDSTIIGSRA